MRCRLPSYLDAAEEAELLAKLIKDSKHRKILQSEINVLNTANKKILKEQIALQDKLNKGTEHEVELQTAKSLLLGKSKAFYEDINNLVTGGHDGQTTNECFITISKWGFRERRGN